jgi:hypothetical protein
MPKRATTVKALLLGAAAAAAILASPPIAGAEPPPPGDPSSEPKPQPVSPGGIVDSAVDGASKQLPPISPWPTTGPPGGVCAYKNGFPIYIPPGGLPSEIAAIPTTGPVTAGPCKAGQGPLPKVADAATDIVDAAVPAGPSEQQPPPGQ